MYAVVSVSGNQVKVREGDRVNVPRLHLEEGAETKIKDVLLVSDEGDVKVGDPVVKGASVSAKVLSHFKGKKVIVFKKKRRKNYRRTKGHRQEYTELLIGKLNVGKG